MYFTVYVKLKVQLDVQNSEHQVQTCFAIQVVCNVIFM